MGFEYFYGFVGGDTSQWQPNLFRNTTHDLSLRRQTGLEPDHRDGRRRHRLACNELNEIDPDKPFFCYYVPGGTHAPHHPTPEWIKKISDMHLFDKGWNELRDADLRQPEEARRDPAGRQADAWPDELLKKWDDADADEKKLFIRQVEVYAAYLAYTDHEIGRVIQAVEDMGKLDNTLIIYISGDNGSSAEGSPDRHAERGRHVQRRRSPGRRPAEVFYDVWGSDQTYNHMAVGWTWAFDTPFKWTKQIASHFGGTRKGMAISWPATSRTRAASATSSTT